VERAYRGQGKGSGRPTLKRVLGASVPDSLVRRCLKEIKAEDACKEREALAQRRTSVLVHYGNALCSLDGLHLGQTPEGALEALILRDVATTTTIAVRVGPPATAEDVIRFLEAVRRARGWLALVLAMDNGPAFTSLVLTLYLRELRVVVLRNLPRTPQHNPWVEHGNGELRRETGLLSRTRKARLARASSRVRSPRLAEPGLDDAAPSQEALVLAYAQLLGSALQTLDGQRLRKSRGYRTAAAVDAETPSWYGALARDDFYAAACAAVRKAVLGCNTKRGRRLAARKALLVTMQQYGIASTTVGAVPLPAVEAEEISCHPHGPLPAGEAARAGHGGLRYNDASNKNYAPGSQSP
jgi:hypothetical protein